MNTTKRMDWVDFTRVLAMLMVLVLHAAAPYVDRFQQVPIVRWQYAHFFESITRVSVPLFFMLSGMLLLQNTAESPADFYRKRLRRILPAFLFWSVVYIFWGQLHHEEDYTLSSAFKALLTGGIRFHLWFVYTLIGLYLLTPILRLVVHRLPRFITVGMVTLWVALIAIAPVFNVFSDTKFPVETDSQILLYIGYFLLGCLLAGKRLTTRRGRLIWALVWLSSLAFTYHFTYIFSLEKGEPRIMLYHFESANVVLMTVSLFLILKSVSFDNLYKKFPRLRSAVGRLSAVSYGLYCGHVLFQEALWENWPDHISTHPLLVIPVIVLSVLILTGSFLLLARRIPLLRHLVT